MTNAEMLADLRTKLDEAAEGYWKDVECYRALSNGQVQTANLILATYKVRKGEIPETFANLIKEASGTTDVGGEITLPADYMYLLNAQITSGSVPCYIIESNREYFFRESNSYLKATSTNPTVQIVAVSGVTKLRFSLTSVGVNYHYLKTPADIDASTQPDLLEMAHPSIVTYAFADLLKKAERYTEATQNINQFIRMVQILGDK